jgi:hypothetical protein
MWQKESMMAKRPDPLTTQQVSLLRFYWGKGHRDALVIARKIAADKWQVESAILSGIADRSLPVIATPPA